MWLATKYKKKKEKKRNQKKRDQNVVWLHVLVHLEKLRHEGGGRTFAIEVSHPYEEECGD